MVVVEESQAPPRWSASLSVGVVWVLVLVGAGLTLRFAEGGTALQWFSIVLAGATIAAFCLQLALDSKVGFVNRLATTVAGSLVILAGATALLALVPALGG